ncbi:MAG: sensor histidine kinase [Candidatus Entotheonellia bacterium]
MEDALQVSETRYRRLFETARDGILLVDAGTHHITDANPFMVELLGYARDELLGKELWEIGLLMDADASRNAFRALQATGYIRYEDLPLQTKADARREVEFVSNVYLENGHQVIQCNIRDITARRQAEAELRALNADLEQRVWDRTGQLEALNHELEAFNASVSHDLHTPLRQIDDVVEALQEDYADRLDAAGLQLMQRIPACTQRMKALIDALLALARVSRHALEWQSVDLSALAHVVAAELQHRQPTRQIDWVIADGLTARGDPRLLHIVLDNLLSNAWKFTSTNA